MRLTSDELTTVTLYRVGALGAFASHDVELRPGTYTAIGSRDGYRDVRQTFTVRPGWELAAHQRGLRRTHLRGRINKEPMAATTQPDGRGPSVTVEEGGRRREFGPGDLPISLGAGGDADVVLDGAQGSIQIGRLDEVFFVQPGAAPATSASTANR